MSSVCVIIPTADRPSLLLRAVESVLRQSRVPERIIVVDNGIQPVDASLFGPSINVIRTSPRIGPGRSRNVGVSHAFEDCVAFLDDDDVWDSEYLKHSMELVEGGACVVVGKLKRRSVDGLSDNDYKLFPSEALKQRAVYYKNPGFGGQNIILRRELFIGVGGFDEVMPASVDRDLAARILQAGETIHVQSKSVAVLCDHDGGRVRASQVKGNYMFIIKHWRHMSVFEILLAVKTYLKRYIRRNYIAGEG